jgi:2',3'-cyclic-nucleotide 2'-phosphodiesterase (5'-nucleotidase family)
MFMRHLTIKSLFFAVALFIGTTLYGQFTPVSFNYTSIKVDSANAIAPDSAIAKYIDKYRLEIQKDMNVVIAVSEQTIEADKPEGTLNDLVADAVFEMGKLHYKPTDGKNIDFCLLNYGGLRKSLPKGNIMIGNVFELMPFDNKLSVITLKGAQVAQLFDFLAKKIEGHPIANCRLVVDQNQATLVIIGGMPLDTSKTYKVVTNDYLSGGNDGMYFFKQAVTVEAVDYLIRDAIVDYLRKIGVKPIAIEKDGRYTLKN